VVEVSYVAALSLLLALAVPVRADERDPVRPHPPVVLPGTEIRFLHSRNTSAGYKLYVALPKSYDKARRDYPLVVALDADYSFALAKNVSEHLSDRGGLPEVVVVGVAYADEPAYRVYRTRDYTPTRSLDGYAPQIQEHSGGAPRFLAFLKEELLPFIRGRYRVQDVTLVGHSYGGLFAAFALATEPNLFAAHVIVSPSLWYDERWIMRTKPKIGAGSGARVYMAIGAEEESKRRPMVTDLRELDARLAANGLKSNDRRLDVLAGENHDSVFPAALTRGLRFVLAR
jgi:predicted alpha/beta superfamily hydrolase